MTFRIANFELDAQKFELREDGARVAVEPQVLSLLLLLIERRDRVVTRDEIIETVWKGRIVSDAAVASRIKSARQALGDDGDRQQMIRTLHGKGFRFVHPVEEVTAAAAPAQAANAAPTPEPAQSALSGRPSIAVLPFQPIGAVGPHAIVASALPHDLITALSKLRWLFVVARGSSFQFYAPDVDLAEVGRVLGARYCLSGALEVIANRIVITVEMADTRDSGIVWSERYEAAPDEVHEIRARIVASVISATELQLPLHAADSALLRDPQGLDVWTDYHLGVRHMYRLTSTDNAIAIAMFERAIAKDPNFARAEAGLSFCHFQNAFRKYTPDTAGEALLAHRRAERALTIDPLDPFANLTKGRAYFMTGDPESSLAWLDRAITLSPNYAQGFYSRSWAKVALCRGEEVQVDSDAAMALSPIDPLYYAMLGIRSLSHLLRGQDAEAAQWGDRAARAPGAHALVSLSAAVCQAARGDFAAARYWLERARESQPGIGQADFFRSFPLEDARTRARVGAILTSLGV